MVLGYAFSVHDWGMGGRGGRFPLAVADELLAVAVDKRGGKSPKRPGAICPNRRRLAAAGIDRRDSDGYDCIGAVVVGASTES